MGDREKDVKTWMEKFEEVPKPDLSLDKVGEEETVDALTTYFRRTSRGRIVEMPSWAQ